jgi:hypothetical protein
MVNYRWRFSGKTEHAMIYVDYNRKMTKIVGKDYIYYHKGLFPFHRPEYTKRYRR